MFKFRTFLWSLLVLMVSLPILAQDFSSQKQTVGKYTTNGTTGSQNTESTVLRWDNGTNLDAIGLTSGGTFSVAARFTPTELGAVATQGLMSVEVYINDVPTSARLVLYGPNTDLIAGPEVYSQAFTPVALSWNTITLTTPYIVTGTTDLWIGYEVTHATGSYPCGVDPGPAAYNGDRIYSGGVWDRLSVLAPTLNYNWNIAATFDLVGPPCPVVPASNPSPADGTTGVSITTPGNATWTNGAGTNNVEVFFGPVGNLVSVYSGAPIASLPIPSPLNYATVYQWRVVDKNDTCSAAPVATWSFTTEQNPNVLFEDFFANFSQWTAVGPLGLTNWSSAAGTNAGGATPELKMSWTPSFNGESRIRSVVINAPNSSDLTFQFKWFFDWYADPSGTIALEATYDGGVTKVPLWSNVNPTGNVGPADYTVNFTTPASGSSNLQLELSFNGNSFNNDNMYFDNMQLTFVVPVELTSFAATTDNKNVNLNWSDSN